MKSERLPQRILVGVSGASGTVYAQRLCQVLLGLVDRVYLVATDAAMQVAKHELESDRSDFPLLNILGGDVPTEFREQLRVFRANDLFAPVASGSSAPTAMIVVPCSMGSLSRIATGQSSNLLERAADVVLKQKRRLIICPRETPLNVIHLRNMLSLAEAGASILPAMPAFYQKPESIEDMIDFVVGRVLEMLEIPHELYRPWNARMR